MTYEKWIHKWIERKEKLVKESTFASYSNILVNHLLPKFGKYEITNITEDEIQKYVFELLSSGRLDSRGGLCERASKDIIVVLKNTLKDAIRIKLLPPSIFEIRFPISMKSQKLKIIPWDVQQRLIQSIYLNLNRKTVGILLCLYTGLRIGEICGLKDSDLNFESQVLNVSRTLQRIYKKNLDGTGKSRLIETPPKSRTSSREIPLSQILIPVLSRFQKENSDNYFLTGSKKCIEVRTYRSFFETFLQRNNIEKFNFHSLRHTFATRCIEAGADCKTVSEILGHSTVNMTLNLYVHPQIEQKRKCVNMLK